MQSQFLMDQYKSFKESLGQYDSAAKFNGVPIEELAEKHKEQ